MFVTAPSHSTLALADKATRGSSAADEFSAFMKETPAQRLRDQWLSSHHVTKEEFDAMSPSEKEALERQMADDLKKQATAKSDSRNGFVI